MRTDCSVWNVNCTQLAKLYTGAQRNILPLSLYRRIYTENLTQEGFHKLGVLKNSTTVLTAFMKGPSWCNMRRQCQFATLPLQIPAHAMSMDVFQTKAFEGCEGTIGIGDDVVIFGKSEQENDHHINGMLTRCRDTGLKLNREKCKI